MKDETGKVTFDADEQAKVDEIVKDRLEREKAKYEGYEDLKEIDSILSDFGYEGTAQEKKAVLRQQAEEAKKQRELTELQDEAQADGTSPELLREMKDLKAELAELKKDKEDRKRELEAKKQEQEKWNSQVSEFQEKYKDIDLEKLNKNEKFIKFAKKAHPSLTLSEVYESYVELVGEAEANAIEKIKSNVDRSTSSGRSKGDSSGGTYGLTPQQQELADENGMTCKEYSELLKNIRK